MVQPPLPAVQTTRIDRNMTALQKAECSQFSAKLYRLKPQRSFWQFQAWDFDGLLVYGFTAVWFWK